MVTHAGHGTCVCVRLCTVAAVPCLSHAETYKVVVLRSEGASELGISGEYILSVGEDALLLKTASGFEVQRWPHSQVRRLAKCQDTPGKLLLDIAQ